MTIDVAAGSNAQNRSLFSLRSAGKLRTKAGRTWWTVRREGHRECLLKRGGKSGEARGKFSQPVVLPGLQGKGMCGKEASLLKALLLLLVHQK